MTPRSPALSGSTVSAGLVAGLADYAQRAGAHRAALLEQAGIDSAPLADPDARLPFGAYQRLLQAARRACDDPALAVHFGAAVDMSELSIVGLIMNASATMGEAFAQLIRYGGLAVEASTPRGSPRFALADRDGAQWIVDGHAGAMSPELVEAAFARLVCGPRRFLPRPHVLEVHFRHGAPAYADECRRVFQCPVRFSSGWDALRLAPGVGDWPVSQQPRYVFGVLIDRAERLLSAIEAGATFRGRVEAQILPALHTGRIGAERIAAQLGLSRQTLFRRLKREGVTFEAVLNDLRRRAAELYLEGGQASVNETAYLVGFSDAAAFSRAFKRWTGRSPSHARRAPDKPGDGAPPPTSS